MNKLMNKEEYKKAYQALVDECDKVLNKIMFENESFKKIINLTSKGVVFKRIGIARENSQYDNIIYWYRVLFKDVINYNGIKIVGFHIMPFQITSNDVKKAEWRYNTDIKEKRKEVLYKHNGMKKKKYYDELKEDLTYIDYDWDVSGNFHKYPDNNFDKLQITLIDQETYINNHNGVGDVLVVKGNPFNDELVNRIRKRKMYFPNIEDKEINNKNQLEDLIKNVLVVLNIK